MIVLGNTAFGVDCNSLKRPEEEFHKLGSKFFDGSLRNELATSLGVLTPNIFKLFKIKLVDPAISSYFISLLQETIYQRKAHNIDKKDMLGLIIQLMEKNSNDEDNKINNNDFVPVKSDFGPINFNELAAQAFIFFIGGYETTSVLLTYTLYELVLNEEIQNKVRKEIEEVVEKHEGNITYQALQDMQYLDCVIKGKFQDQN